MSQQIQITNYFKTKGSMHLKINSNADTKIRLRRNQETPTPSKIRKKNDDIQRNVVTLSSSDDEVDIPLQSTPECNNILANISLVEDEILDCSGRTEDYSISPYLSKRLITSPVKTPIKSQTRNLPSTSKNKFFSPNKKRSVTKRSPTKVLRNLTADFSTIVNKISFQSHEDELFNMACGEQDDKTIFFLHIIKEYLKDVSVRPLLDDEARLLLINTMLLHKPGAKVVCRLFWRREGWYKKSAILDIAKEGNNHIDEQNAEAMILSLVHHSFLIKGDKQNMKTMEDFTKHLLKLEDIQSICKVLKIKKQSKENSLKALQHYSKTSNVSSFFTKGASKSNVNNVLNLMSQSAGECYMLSEKARSTLHRLYLLTYIGIDYKYIREKNLELMLIYNKIQKETFPIDPNMKLDKPQLFFPTRETFEHYVTAREMYEAFIASDSINKCVLGRQTYKFFVDMNNELMKSYRSLPPWLRRFTPAYLYIKIMEESVIELKKGKNQESCQLAVDMLDALIGQNLFRQHRRAEWYAEKGLILHSYLQRPNEAAKVFLEGFQLDLPEQSKDHMRPRALKIAKQKNINIDDDIKDSLLYHANKISIMEGSLPSTPFYKPAMENTTKGKATYKTRTENGTLVQGVEEYALSCYLQTGDYTHGRHWEGRIITNIFFLIFWNIIYKPLTEVPGIFLSHYQRFPLDLFCDTFYKNRKVAIDERLMFIEESTIDQILTAMETTWNSRPETELSGLSRDIEWSSARAVCQCLGPRALTAICRRLVTDYRYCHSGFPDLTIWNVHNNKIKFVEVKSDNDKPSMKQIQWMQYLRLHHIDTEFCYVGVKTNTKSRTSVQHKTAKLP